MNHERVQVAVKIQVTQLHIGRRFRTQFLAGVHKRVPDEICDAFEAAWLAGREPRIEDFLLRGDPGHQDQLLRELLLAEWDVHRRHGRQPQLES
jgi:hypothetical protein